MTLSELLSDVYETTGHSATPPTEVATRITRYINAGYMEVFQHKHFRRLLRLLTTVDTIADSPFIAMPQVASRIFGIADRTNDRNIVEKSMPWIRAHDPALSMTQANPEFFAIYNLASPVARQPSAACDLWLDSTSAADTMNANLQLIRTGGHQRNVQKALTGLTAVAIDANTDYTHIIKFYLASAAAGDVTLMQDTGTGTVLATIPIGKTKAVYSLVHLWPVPSSVVTLHVDMEVKVLPLVELSDEPLFDERFHNILADKARAKEFLKREKPQLAREADAEFQQGIARMITHYGQPQGGDEPREGGFSQLGPMYSAGT